MLIHYSKTSAKSFDTLVTAVQESSVNHGFRVLYTHNVQQTLGEKGFAIPQYSIVEVCNAKFAHEVLSKDLSIGMMLPCRLAVYDENGNSRVTMMLPSMIGQLMPEANLGTVPQDVEKILIDVIDEAVK